MAPTKRPDPHDAVSEQSSETPNASRGSSIGSYLDAARVQDAAATPENLRLVVDKAQAWVKAKHPQLKQSDIDQLVKGPDIDEFWTLEDEDKSRTDWNNDPMKAHLLRPKHTKLNPPWKYSIRFFGMFIEDIIGPRFNLSYDHSGHVVEIMVNGESVKHPYWSAPFCDSLFPLLSHDMWQNQPGALAVCLQYVVKCRTNDQRAMRWPRENYTTDKFFDVFADVTADLATGQATVIDVHAEVRSRLNGIQSPWSRLFQEIEASSFNKSCQPKTTPPVQGQHDVGTYVVGKNELDRLTVALDNLKDRNGLPVYRTALFTSKAATSARGPDLPSNPDMPNVREKALLSIRQHAIRAEKISQASLPDVPLDIDYNVETTTPAASNTAPDISCSMQGSDSWDQDVPMDVVQDVEENHFEVPDSRPLSKVTSDGSVPTSDAAADNAPSTPGVNRTGTDYVESPGFSTMTRLLHIPPSNNLLVNAQAMDDVVSSSSSDDE